MKNIFDKSQWLDTDGTDCRPIIIGLNLVGLVCFTICGIGIYNDKKKQS